MKAIARIFPLRFVPFVLKQVVRHRTRSLLTAAGVGAAMLLYCGVTSLQTGMETVTRAGAADTKLIVYRKDRYCPSTSRMPQGYLERIRKIPGVVSAVPLRIVVNNCKTSLDVVTFRGVPEDDFLAVFAPRITLLQGSFDDWRKRSDAVLLGETLARRRGLKPGDRFDAAGITVYVAGVIRSDEAQDANAAYSHLSFIQYASGGRQGGYVTQFNVRVDRPANLERVAAAIDSELAGEAEPTQTRSEKAFVASTAKDILEIVAFTRWLGWGCLAAMLALVANALFLAVQQRVREQAVLQTLGFRTELISRLIISEAMVLSVAGGLIGAVIAAGFLRFGHWSLSVEGVSIPIAATPGVLIHGLLISAIVGVVAGTAPAILAARRDIVTCFRDV